MGCWRPSSGHDHRVRLRDLYGGRHLRTTLVLATTSAAAGALTGIAVVGTNVTGATAATTKPAKAAPVRHAKPHPHAAATTLSVEMVHRRATASPSPSATSASPSPRASRATMA